MNTSTLVPVVVAALAPLAAYLLAVRRFSGRIESSEAKDLWDESRSIRDWSSAQLIQVSERALILEKRVFSLETEKEKYIALLADCQEQLRVAVERGDRLEGK